MRMVMVSLAALSVLWAVPAAAADPPPKSPPSSTPPPKGPQQPVTVTPSGAAPVTTSPSTTPAAADQSLHPGMTTTTSAETEAVIASPAPPSDVPAPEEKQWINRPLLITGAIVFAASYVPAVLTAFESERNADQKNLYYPVVGPWMNLADRQCNITPCNNEGLNKTLLVLSGVGQGLGALGIVTSFFLPNSTTRNWYLIGNDNVRGGPMSVGTGYGLGAVGRF